MKRLKLFYLLIFTKIYFACCTPVATENLYSEVEERIVKLELENSELRVENARLKLEIVQLRKENEKTSTLTNFTSAVDRLKGFTENVNTIWVDVQSFKDYIDNLLKKNSEVNSIRIKPEENEIKVKSLSKNCATNEKSGVYTIELPMSGTKPFAVVCDADTQFGGWTLIQQRIDGGTNFFRPWSDYKTGFGTLSVNGEFFIGLERLYQITTTEPYELLVILQEFNNATHYANYDSIVIGSEAEGYALKGLGSYSGSAGDSLTYHKGQKFSTFDRDNDKTSQNCAQDYKGGWWFNECHFSNLNGMYYNDGTTVKPDGIVWYHLHNNNIPLKLSKMMIRPKSVLPEMCKQFIKNN